MRDDLIDTQRRKPGERECAVKRSEGRKQQLLLKKRLLRRVRDLHRHGLRDGEAQFAGVPGAQDAPELNLVGGTVNGAVRVDVSDDVGCGRI